MLSLTLYYNIWYTNHVCEKLEREWIMSNKKHIVVDAMGGDNAPQEIVKGVVSAVLSHDDILVTLTGDEALVRAELAKYKYPEESIRIRHTTEVIATAEHPVEAVRTKKDSSMVVGMKMLRDGEADAFLTAGNSGAVLVGGQTVVGRLKGLSRAPLAVLIPTEKQPSLLLDCGANVDARPEQLLQFAIMGSIYMEHVLGRKNPRVGIVNIGAEEEKGNALVKTVFPMLKACEDINFTGSVEARDIPLGDADVIVAEAFVGNVILKMYEGVAKSLMHKIKGVIKSKTKTKIGGLLIKNELKDALKDLDSANYGGAPLLGCNGLVVKMHGNATEFETKNSVLQCRSFLEADITNRFREYFSRALQGELS